MFLSYGRRDAKDLADQLSVDLAAAGYEVWQDTSEIRAGHSWEQQIEDGLRSTQVVIALLSPHAVRRSTDRDNPTAVDSVCLDEISFARFATPPTPIVPAMAVSCEPPFSIFRLDYVDLCSWRESDDAYKAGLSRLIEGIESAGRGEVRYRAWEHELKPWDFSAFLHAKRRDFVGRDWLFDKIDAWRVANVRERALLIKGDPGTGKSAIVAELVHRNPHGQVLAYHCCQWDVQETLQPWRFVRSIAAMIASKLDTYATMLSEPAIKEALSESNCKSDPSAALERGVMTPLQKLQASDEGPRFILVPWIELDEVWKGVHRDEAATLRRQLEIIDCEIKWAEDGERSSFEFTDAEIEALGRLEHERFVQLRQRAGWLYGPTYDAKARTSPHLVPWHHLPEEMHEYSRVAVRGLKDRLAQTNLSIHRRQC